MPTKFPIRVIDTDLGDGRMNIAQGQALMELHQQDKAGDTLRFMRFNPAAIIGRHQILSHEVNLAYCKQNNIEIVRRITGGGAIFLDPGQLGWELAISRKNLPAGQLADITKILCEAAASGLSRLGLDVRFRPRNDLEVDGRKISGTGGFFDGDTLFFQGTVLVDMNPAHMVAALHIPAAKLAKHNLKDAGQRVTTLRQLLGDKTPSLDVIREELTAGICEALNLQAEKGNFSAQEVALAKEYYDDEIGQDDFVEEIDRTINDSLMKKGSCQSPGGLIECYLKLEGATQNRLGEVAFTGDLFISPPRIIYDLEAHLKGVFIDQLEGSVRTFFERADVNLMSVTPEHFITSLNEALKQ
ncbi:MAG: lipoate--protein ligase [Gammaproteobacteria bacterium]|nr:MAG: lipoate--protein ligase [Gammaproteobacteria bacterium]